LCRQDAYLLELVRYIHLNLLRARLVKDMDQLVKYPFSRHGIIMGKFDQSWRDWKVVLAFFGKQTGSGGYQAFVTKGIEQGRRNDLTGGGLIRRSGGLGRCKGHAESQGAYEKRRTHFRRWRFCCRNSFPKR
jgi:putative transposase